MATSTPPHRPPSDFSAGATPSGRPPPPRRRHRGLRMLGWLLAALAALVVVVAASVWWWAGSNTSLAMALARAAQYLPAGQQLQSRDVSGSLRSGGRIGWLRWSSPSLQVEVDDITIGWQLAPLLQRRLELGEVHAARVQVTPLESAPKEESPEPLTQLVLPLQIKLPFRVDEVLWAGPQAVQAQGLEGRYEFTGQEHRLGIDSLALAQGRYTARLALQAQAPMAIEATVDGNVDAHVPGGGAALQLGAHANLTGTLASAAARLQLEANLRPVAPVGDGSGEPMQANVKATIAPWDSQPLHAADAALQAVDVATLWPSAPATRLYGTVQAGPAAGGGSGATGWAVKADLRNELAGPWDKGRLPITALQAQAAYDGEHWSVPAATASAGGGTVAAQGRFTPATKAVEGRAELHDLRPDALHTQLAAAPLAGSLSARTQGDTVHFDADVRAARGARAARPDRTGGRPAPLRINAFTAKGSWQPAPGSGASAGGTAAAGTLQLERLVLDALQARAEATQLQIALPEPTAQGRLALTVPGASLRAEGKAAPASGAGEAQLHVTDSEAAVRWLTSIPWVGAKVQEALKGASARGSAQLSARWNGGWQVLLDELGAAGSGKAPAPQKNAFALQAHLSTSQLDVALPPGKEPGEGATALQLRAVKAELSGTLAQAVLSLDGEARLNASAPQQMQRLAMQTRLAGGLAGPGQWRAQLQALQLQAQDAQRPGPWTLQLADAVDITARRATSSARGSSATSTTVVEAAAGQARLTGPAPGAVALRWQPARVITGERLQILSQGTLEGLPLAWVDALGIGRSPAGAGGAEAQPLLARMGLASSLLLDGQWNVDTLGTPQRASASLRRASGDLRILAGDATAVTAVQSSGQGAGAGATTVVATEATASAAVGGSPAGVRQAELALELDGDALRARLMWASERAGDIQANVGTRLSLPGAANPTIAWDKDAPLSGTLQARMPDVGVWSALAPPGWRVRGTLDANAALSGTRALPQWSGTLAADGLAVRSVVDGVDLQNGRLRATLRGNQLDITEFRLHGGRGSGARIAGFSGNRTAPPQDGGSLVGSGTVTWVAVEGEAAQALSGIAMDFRAEAKRLQVLARADRQLSVSGQLQAQLQQGQISVRGKLTTDRATIILPDESAPKLGPDVVVRSAAKDREDQAKAAAAARANQAAAQPETIKPPDIAITLNLGRDFALQGHGITTRLRGELDIRSSTVPSAPPRLTGEVRTEEGRYRAWGQMLDVETGLIRFNGPYNNPSLDILALRPNISVRAGVQVTGSAQAPRVRLYSDPELPDAEKLSWVVLGRNAAAGGAEAAVLQQAALALLGRGGSNNTTANAASRLGLDEIGFKGPGSGEDASAAALTFGKRLSRNLYVTYERSLSGTLGTLYIFYDLSRRLTLRGQTGEKSAVDIIYTMTYDGGGRKSHTP